MAIKCECGATHANRCKTGYRCVKCTAVTQVSFKDEEKGAKVEKTIVTKAAQKKK